MCVCCKMRVTRTTMQAMFCLSAALRRVHAVRQCLNARSRSGASQSPGSRCIGILDGFLHAQTRLIATCGETRHAQRDDRVAHGYCGVHTNCQYMGTPDWGHKSQCDVPCIHTFLAWCTANDVPATKRACCMHLSCAMCAQTAWFTMADHALFS
jgi:hypothetical protein